MEAPIATPAGPVALPKPLAVCPSDQSAPSSGSPSSSGCKEKCRLSLSRPPVWIGSGRRRGPAFWAAVSASSARVPSVSSVSSSAVGARKSRMRGRPGAFSFLRQRNPLRARARSTARGPPRSSGGTRAKSGRRLRLLQAFRGLSRPARANRGLVDCESRPRRRAGVVVRRQGRGGEQGRSDQCRRSCCNEPHSLPPSLEPPWAARLYSPA
jgi:hypothetical protein